MSQGSDEEWEGDIAMSFWVARFLHIVLDLCMWKTYAKPIFML